METSISSRVNTWHRWIGEYSVTQPGNTGILVAVNSFMTISLEKSQESGSISLDKRIIPWIRKKDKILLESPYRRLRYLLATLDTVEEYARELGRKPGFYHLKVESQLESKEGKKYGLGSSAAIVVALVEALNHFYRLGLDKKKIFKLAVLASIPLNRDSSYGDIAACSYGGWLAYSSPDFTWLDMMGKKLPISSLINKTWPLLKIQPLSPPDNLHLAVAWTGRPASTINLLRKIKIRRQTTRKSYRNFLNKSQSCVNQIITAFENKDIKEIKRGIQDNRRLLAGLGKSFKLQIESPKLRKLAQIASKHGASGKLSGAGGGDCGIAILSKKDKLKGLIRDWEKAGIEYLPLKVFHR